MFAVTWPVGERGTHAVIGVATRCALHYLCRLKLPLYFPFQGVPPACCRLLLPGGGLLPLLGLGPGQEMALPRGRRGTPVPQGPAVGLDCASHLPSHPGHGRKAATLRPSNVWPPQAGTLAFEASGQYLGVAFSGLKAGGQPLFPCVSTVWGNSQVLGPRHCQAD